jgi:hypothetical protein
MSFKLTWKSHVICILISVILVLILNPIFDGVISELFHKNIIFYPTKYILLNYYIYIIILIIPISVVHKIIHGAAYKLFGGEVKFGFKGIYAYTIEI